MSQCLNVDVSSFGTNVQEAIDNLKEAMELYFEDISKADKEGRNLAEERYTRMFQRIGYSSIAEAEKKLTSQRTKEEANV